MIRTILDIKDIVLDNINLSRGEKTESVIV